MASLCSRAARYLILPMCFIMVASHTAGAQTADTSAVGTAPDGALQFHILGLLGVNYLGNYGQDSYYRIGINGSINHSDQSDDFHSHSYRIPETEPGEYWQGENEQAWKSYTVEISALYMRQIAHYKNSTMYCGIGPFMRYEWSTNTYTTSRAFYNEGGQPNPETGRSEGRSRRISTGPMAVFGIRCHVAGPVSLCAEAAASAAYRWDKTTTEETSITGNLPTSPVRRYNGEAHSSGWSIWLESFRIGCIIEL